MQKSPWLAVGLSAVAPGAGQIYDAGYWKAPLIWGVGGLFLAGVAVAAVWRQAIGKTVTA